jgi:predicted HTH transcriptional regulator
LKQVEAERLVDELRAQRSEREWFEFKENKADPEDIGEYISALSNGAALVGQPRGFIVWGVHDASREVVGTTFSPREAKVGNEDLESWLSHMLSPRVDFTIHEHEVRGRRVVIFEIPAALHTPVRFRSDEFIRVGSYNKKIRDYPEKERALWRILARSNFEDGIGADDVSADQVVDLLDYPTYFTMSKRPLPTDRDAIIESLLAERFVARAGRDRYGITNLGAILFARRLSDVGLARKGVRAVIYKGVDRTETVREQTGYRGYAIGFENLINFINDNTPLREIIGQAIRTERRMFPEIAIRELTANALIHQDFRLTGTGPMVEIFSDRVEITNPGVPLMDVRRLLDLPPQSRNDSVGAMMRRLGICEERGTGIDKVISSVELAQLPAPEFRVTDNHTRVILFAHRKLRAMSREDRIRACYQHAALLYVSSHQLTNATLRERLGIASANYAMASRIIAETVDAGLIKAYDPTNRSKKHARYVPFWA